MKTLKDIVHAYIMKNKLAVEVDRLNDHLILINDALEKQGFEIRAKSKRSLPVEISKAFDRDGIEELRLLSNDTDTSKQAAILAQKNRLSHAQLIWMQLREKGPMTTEEIANSFEKPMLIQTASARVNDLKKLGYIRDTGERRHVRGSSGTLGIVHEAVYQE